MKEKIIRFFIGSPNPVNAYDSCPVLFWIMLFILIGYGVLGLFVIFK